MPTLPTHSIWPVVLGVLLLLHIEQGLADEALKVDSEQPAATQSLALIAIYDPSEFTVYNYGGGWRWLGMANVLLALPGHMMQKKVEAKYAAQLTKAMQEHDLHIGQALTVALSEALSQLGYTIELITTAKRLENDPAVLDFDSVNPAADMFVFVYYSDAGLYSWRTPNYLPQLNIEVEVYRPHDEESVFAESLYYGAYASQPEDNQIPSDVKYAFATFDEAIHKRDEIAQSYQEGIALLAARAAQHIHTALPKPTVESP